MIFNGHCKKSCGLLTIPGVNLKVWIREVLVPSEGERHTTVGRHIGAVLEHGSSLQK